MQSVRDEENNCDEGVLVANNHLAQLDLTVTKTKTFMTMTIMTMVRTEMTLVMMMVMVSGPCDRRRLHPQRPRSDDE